MTLHTVLWILVNIVLVLLEHYLSWWQQLRVVVFGEGDPMLCPYKVCSAEDDKPQQGEEGPHMGHAHV